ncbi:MAG: GNAT family N-acetyltransferase [Acidobacteriota bacterium]|nr:GNAT family N-acetyltransferase [Acidobacteriota bacterium]MDH3522863.1 GNAT family N-acetyltransferase [Acidobacteriota bacterium]
MQKHVKLKDQSEVLIREMTRDDLAASLAFFESLSEEDRTYLRRDVTKREVVERRIREVEAGTAIRLVAVADGQIVADGSLEISSEEWKAHVGELRLIIARPYRRKGLGIRLAGELFLLASSARVEEIVVRMMRPQKAARSIFRKLGFRQETVLPDYVKDLSGTRQDMILMRCDLEALWSEMEDFIATGDWQRTQ